MSVPTWPWRQQRQHARRTLAGPGRRRSSRESPGWGGSAMALVPASNLKLTSRAWWMPRKQAPWHSLMSSWHHAPRPKRRCSSRRRDKSQLGSPSFRSSEACLHCTYNTPPQFQALSLASEWSKALPRGQDGDGGALARLGCAAGGDAAAGEGRREAWPVVGDQTPPLGSGLSCASPTRLIPGLFQFGAIGRRRPPQPPLALRVPLTRAPPRSHALH